MPPAKLEAERGVNESMSAGNELTARASGRVPTVTVVLPCLDEASSIVACIEEARYGLDRSGLTGEILVVDNGSTDGSVDLALAAGARVISEAVTGVGSALRTGFREARGDLIVMADADGTYDLSRLGELVTPVIDDEVDLMLGARLDGSNRGTMPFLHRFIGTPVLSFLLRRACRGMDIRDSQSGYRAMNAEKARALDLKATGFEMTSEMLIRSSQEGWRIGEKSIEYRPRLGKSKLNTLVDGWRHLQLILLLAPQLLLFWPGLSILGAGLVLSVLSLLSPGGFDLGPLRWQPIFFAPILIVLGAMAFVAGAVVAYHSPLLRPDVARQFSIVGNDRFPAWCIAAGVSTLIVGLGIDLVLFSIWVTNGSSPSRALALAGIAQSLVIAGAALGGFGLIYGVLARQHSYRSHDGDVDILRFNAKSRSPLHVDGDRSDARS